MDKIVKKGKVVMLPLNDDFSALHIDFNGVGFPLGELFKSEGLIFEECFFCGLPIDMLTGKATYET